MAFVGAGLPSAVTEVLSDEVLTFLRRADRYHLGRVSFDDIADAIRTPIRDAGRSITPELSARAAQATDGYPFLIQLVGYHVWRLHPSDDEVAAEDVDVGILAELRRLGSLVVEPSLADLSNVDRTFLLAMAQDDGPSRMIDIANRLNCDANYASQYRRGSYWPLDRAEPAPSHPPALGQHRTERRRRLPVSAQWHLPLMLHTPTPWCWVTGGWDMTVTLSRVMGSGVSQADPGRPAAPNLCRVALRWWCRHTRFAWCALPRTGARIEVVRPLSFVGGRADT